MNIVELIQIIDSVIDSSLTPREVDVINRRLGMNNHDEQTLDQIGEVHDITAERVRRIEAKALRKLVIAIVQGRRGE